MKEIQIYTPAPGPALVYICDFVFAQVLGWKPTLITNTTELRAGIPVVNYTPVALENALQISPTGYLSAEDYLSFPKIEMDLWEDLPVFFQTDGDIPFDLFSAAFFLLTRAEEYKSQKTDEHQRFCYRFSLFSDTDIVERPIVDEWILRLGQIITEQFGLQPKARKFNWINTIDVDVAYAFRGRSLFRAGGAAARDLLLFRWKTFGLRIAALVKIRRDPFDTYELQKQISEQYQPTETVYFFLMENRGKFDHALHFRSSLFKKLIQSISAYAKVGIHPSYTSTDSLSQISTEIRRLSAILNRPVTISRNHFLKLKIPHTCKALLASGITTDYTLGYPCTPGFRAGTCTPFYFFDLNKNAATDLLLVPLIVMDASLKNYQQLSTADAKIKIQQLIHRVKAVNGTFVSLWHNESLSDWKEWKGWRDVYLHMAQQAGAESSQ